MRARANYDKVFEVLKNIIKGTQYENHVFTVGGCERDRIIGGIVKDVDIVIDLPNGGIEFAHWLKENGHTEGSVVVYEHFGTAMFTLKEAPFDNVQITLSGLIISISASCSISPAVISPSFVVLIRTTFGSFE